MADQRGFTLIEFAILLGILGALTAVLFAALNPVARFREARDAKRWSDAQNILKAIKADQTNNGGSYMQSVSELEADVSYQIGTAKEGCDTGCGNQTTAPSCANLVNLVSEHYMTAVPFDAKFGNVERTNYFIIRHASGALEVGACNPESTDDISVMR